MELYSNNAFMKAMCTMQFTYRELKRSMNFYIILLKIQL